MTTIIDRTDLNLHARLSVLEAVAKSLFEDKYDVRTVFGNVHVWPREHNANPHMTALGTRPVIEAYGQVIKNDAELLAKAYEQQFGEEFTIEMFARV